MKKIFLSAALVVAGLCANAQEMAEFPIFKFDKRPHSVFLIDKSKEVAHVHNKGTKVITYQLSQGEVKIKLVKDGLAVELISLLEPDRVEVISHDFNNDNVKEIVVAWQGKEPGVAVFSGSKKIYQTNRLMWEAKLVNSSIVLPYGTNGLYVQATYNKGRFLEEDKEL